MAMLLGLAYKEKDVNMTTTSFFASYMDIESEFKEAEASSTLTQQREDDLTDQLARLWWKLSDEEQKLVEQSRPRTALNGHARLTRPPARWQGSV